MRAMLQLLLSPPGLILIGVILAAIGAFLASQQQGNFERELRAKSEEIAGLNREITNLVTGGDSFCYLAIGSIDSKTNRGIPIVLHQGEHPLFDINVRIVDLQKLREIKDNTWTSFSQAQTNLPVGNLAKGTGLTMDPFDLGSSTGRDFNIFFIARNGQFTQKLRLRKINDKWVRATKIERDGKVIFEKIDIDFPKSNEGNVQW